MSGKMPHNSTKKLKNQDLNTITDLTVKTARISHKERVRTNKSSGARGRSMDSRFRNSKGHIHYKNLDDRPPFDLNTTIDGQEDFPIDEITGKYIRDAKLIPKRSNSSNYQSRKSAKNKAKVPCTMKNTKLTINLDSRDIDPTVYSEIWMTSLRKSFYDEKL